MICRTCRGSLSLAQGAVCRCCGALVAGRSGDQDECWHCRGQRFAFERAVCLGPYRAGTRDAVLRMKQARHEPLTWAIGQLLADHIRQRLTEEPLDVIVPVPMHWSRRWLRGINQAELLAISMARELRLPLHERLLRCRRKTKKQGTLSAPQRRTNVRGAFAVCGGYDISGARILLVDDVLTTGATAHEAAQVCRQAGAERVIVAVVARGMGLA